MMYYKAYNNLYIEIVGQPCASHKLFAKRFDRYFKKVEIIPDENSELITLDFKEKISVSPLYFIGKEAAYNGENFYILDKTGSKLEVDFSRISPQCKFTIEKDFNFSLLATLFQSVLHIKTINLGLVPVHSSCVEYDGSGILFLSWGGSGKTRILLSFIEKGASFVSDDWSILDGNKVHTYYKDFLLMDYDMDEFPKYSKLSKIEKFKLSLNNIFKGNILWYLFHRYNLSLRSKSYDLISFFPAFSQTTNLDKIYFLQKHNGTHLKKKKIGLDYLVDKVYRTFYRENQLFFYYLNLYRFSIYKKEAEYFDQIETIYKKRLRYIFQKKECLLLEIPTEFTAHHRNRLFDKILNT